MFVIKNKLGFHSIQKNMLHLASVFIIFRFDNPAGDTITNSSGKQGTNIPCRNCDNFFVNNRIQIKRYVF